MEYVCLDVGGGSVRGRSWVLDMDMEGYAMTAQNEEKMREEFNPYKEFGYPFGTKEAIAAVRGFELAIAQERIESQKREAALQEQLHAQRMVAIDNKDWFDALKVDYDKLQIELSKYKEAKPVGIVRMSNPPDGNPKPIPKWILSEDQSHLKDGDLLYARPDNARE